MILDSSLSPKFGVEVHARVTSSRLKLMSRSENIDDPENPNLHVDLVDLGMPGALPVLNNETIVRAIRSAIALNMRINESFWFDRKCYFYPDLPLGYQITQFFRPIGINGHLTLHNNKKVRIREMHLETDAGKSIHDGDKTLLDYNRAGCPLLEVVTEPDMRDVGELLFFVRMLRATLKHIGVCDGSMERGNFRVDVSISVGTGNELGTRVEIKNLSSDKAIRNAVEYEVERQIRLISQNEKISQETRLFDEKDRKTVFMRKKENPADYMYAPDPDLPRFCIDPLLLEGERGQIMSLPENFFRELRDNFGIKETEAMSIIENPHVSNFLQEAFRGKKQDLKIQMLKLVLGEIFARLGHDESIPISIRDFSQLATFVLQQKPNSMVLKEIINKLWDGEDLEPLIRSNAQIEDISIVRGYLQEAISENPSEVERYKAGDAKLRGFFIGEVMKKGNNKVSARVINSLIEEWSKSFESGTV